MIKNGVVIAGHVEIGIAIIIEVADSNSLAIMSFATHAGFFGDVGESPIAVVVIKRAAQGMRRLVNVGRRGLDEEEVHQPVLVIVEPGDTGAHGF